MRRGRPWIPPASHCFSSWDTPPRERRKASPPLRVPAALTGRRLSHHLCAESGFAIMAWPLGHLRNSISNLTTSSSKAHLPINMGREDRLSTARWCDSLSLSNLWVVPPNKTKYVSCVICTSTQTLLNYLLFHRWMCQESFPSQRRNLPASLMYM